MQRTCGECRYFRVNEVREDSQVGECRIGRLMGVFRDSMRACPSFARPGETAPPGAGSARRATTSHRGGAPAAPATPAVSASALHDALSACPPDALKSILGASLTLSVDQGAQALGRAWDVGQLILSPADTSLREKELPLDQYFHKLLMVRENLRLIEQKVASHDGLHDGERFDLHRRLWVTQSVVLRLAQAWLPGDVGPEPDEEGGAASAMRLLGQLAEERELADLALPLPPLGERWRGGRATYATEEREVVEPIEVFWRRIVILRDRLSSLEAHLSAHAHIAGDECVAMCGHLRRCHGTMTTFNLLFAQREDYFSSSR